jgi:serine/threonine-protein kinase RsbW
MLDDHTIELSLPNVLGYERIAMGCIASFAKNLGFRDERIEDLKTVVAEACINAVQHGNRGKPGERVIVVMTSTGGSFLVSVIDQGLGIPEPPPKDPDIARIVDRIDPPTGFGLFLIKNLADQVDFNITSQRGHELKIHFKLPS